MAELDKFEPEKSENVELKQWQVNLMLKNMEANSNAIRTNSETIRFLVLLLTVGLVALAVMGAFTFTVIDSGNYLTRIAEDMDDMKGYVYKISVSQERMENR